MNILDVNCMFRPKGLTSIFALPRASSCGIVTIPLTLKYESNKPIFRSIIGPAVLSLPDPEMKTVLLIFICC